jgi:hypothetical protein
VTVIPFEEYVARVLPAEVYTSWPEATLQAQAIAVRTYAWRKIALAPPGADYDVSDWTNDQAMCDRRYPRTDAAAAATAGRYLAYADEIILAQYSAENGHPTADGGLPYLKPVLDPVSLGQARRGHGRGMSQWGAQRWASRYGWNATQILAHYYTGVQVLDVLGGNPSLSLLTPWPGSWLTGSAAYLTAHAAVSASVASTLTFAAPGWGTVDTEPADGWAALWSAPAAPTAPLTLTVSGLGFTYTLPLAGADRELPAGELALPALAPALTVTLQVTATDRGASGVAGVAVGGDWQIRSADLARRSGEGDLQADPAALGGQSLLLPAGATAIWQGVLSPTLAAERIYRAYARLRSAAGPAEAGDRPVRIELDDPASGALLGFADLRPGDFRERNAYQEFPLDFWLAPGASGRLRVRVIAAGGSEFAFDRLRVLFGPQPAGQPLLHGLERRLGAQPVIAKVIDRAGNPSADLPGVTELADVTPPGDWQLVAPAGWVTATVRPTITVRVVDDLAGIDPTSVRFRFTSDAGVSWSAWLSATATVGADVAILTVAWPGGEGGAASRAQFRVADTAGWLSYSPAWPVRVDVTPPATSVSAPALAQPAAEIPLRWEGYDAHGIAAFDVQTGLGPAGAAAWADWLIGVTETTALYSAPISGQTSFRARARDVAGNLGAWSEPATTLVATASLWLPMLLGR